MHSEATKVEMTASVKHDVPIEKKVLSATFNSRAIGVAFKKEQGVVKEYLKTLGEEHPEECEKVADALGTKGSVEIGPCSNGNKYTISSDMVSFKPAVVKIHEEKFIPSVVEPSFGVGRLIYSILEHAFYVREGEEKRNVMAFKPSVAAIKCSVMPMNNSKQFDDAVSRISSSLRSYALAFKTDASSASIGRRYARADEIGVPFAITIDFETIDEKSKEFNTVTVRERDSMKQVRMPIEEVAVTINDIVKERKTWDDLLKKYPQVTVKEE